MFRSIKCIFERPHNRITYGWQKCVLAHSSSESNLGMERRFNFEFGFEDEIKVPLV